MKQRKQAAIRYFCQPADVKGSDTPYGHNLSQEHYVQTGDAKIYYEVYGKGQSVFVFHGGGVGSPYELGAVIDALRKDHQVIAVSTRGHGRSEIGHTSLTFEQKAEDMMAVMQAVTKEPAILLGFSDGAYAAYNVAAMYPEAVDRIIAIGAGTLKKGFFASDITVSDLEKADAAFIAQQMKVMTEPYRFPGFFSGYMKFWSHVEVGKALFSAIRCPVLLIAGDEDDHAPVLTVLEAHQLLLNSRLCIVPKAWHTVFLDNYPVTWAAIDEFVHAHKDDLVSSKKLAYNSW